VEDSNCHEWMLIDACGDVLQYLADWEEVLDLVADVLGYDPLEGYA
jgi:predicted TPR repeat methyltransferase